MASTSDPVADDVVIGLLAKRQDSHLALLLPVGGVQFRRSLYFGTACYEGNTHSSLRTRRSTMRTDSLILFHFFFFFNDLSRVRRSRQGHMLCTALNLLGALFFLQRLRMTVCMFIDLLCVYVMCVCNYA